jgi:CheY-like chemotaxis protein
MKTCPILLVDDNMDDVLLAQLAFRMNNGDNVVVHCVHDGDEAIAYLTGKKEYSDRQRFPMPQYVLLDVNLPRTNGFEVLAWLRQEPGLKRIPVILLSGTNEPEKVNAAYELGVINYLKKPGDFKELLRLVHKIHDWFLTGALPDIKPRPASRGQ